jgi:hypothetical protein
MTAQGHDCAVSQAYLMSRSVVTMGGANLTTVDGDIEAIRRWRDVYNSVR